MSETHLPFERITVHSDAFVAALPEGASMNGRIWRGGGLFQADGQPDLAAAPMMGAEPALDPARLVTAEHCAEGVFCGRYRGHFGHFLAESIGRLWAIDVFPPDVPLIWFNDPYQTGQGLIRKAVLKALQIPNPQIVVNGVLKVDRLHLPPSQSDPLYKITATPAYQDWFRARLPPPPEPKLDLYISRSRMPRVAGRFFGEAAVEDGLRDEGYVVIHPEKLPMEEQIESYRVARRIVLAEGSPLHLLALLDVPGQRIGMLMRRPRIVGTLQPALQAFRQSELVLIDRISKAWGKSADGNLFRVVSELDIAQVWSDLERFGFIGRAANKPVPDAADLAAEHAARAPGRDVRLAIGKRALG